MKKLGVPFTPLRAPPRKSFRTFGANVPFIRACRSADWESPRAPASAR
jgi:hypothetical protein